MSNKDVLTATEVDERRDRVFKEMEKSLMIERNNHIFISNFQKLTVADQIRIKEIVDIWLRSYLYID